jgi:hypothetical protein
MSQVWRLGLEFRTGFHYQIGSAEAPGRAARAVQPRFRPPVLSTRRSGPAFPGQEWWVDTGWESTADSEPTRDDFVKNG